GASWAYSSTPGRRKENKKKTTERRKIRFVVLRLPSESLPSFRQRTAILLQLANAFFQLLNSALQVGRSFYPFDNRRRQPAVKGGGEKRQAVHGRLLQPGVKLFFL